MQYKKVEVREKILQAARKEYLERGYHGGNISAVAERAGVPVGNLYRYFDGKSGLLDAIVGPVYEALPKLVGDLQQIEVLDSATLAQIMPMLTGRLLDFFDMFGDDVLILTDCCVGTKYEDFAEDLTAKVAHVIEAKLYAGSQDEDDRIVAYAIGKAFCSSLFDVLRMGLGRERMQQIVERLIKFYFYETDKRK